MKTTLITILLFCANGIYAQELDKRPMSNEDSLRIQHYKSILRQVVPSRTEIKSEQMENEVPQRPPMVKARANNEQIPQGYANNPELDVLVTNYWENQNSIKEAKNAGEIEQIESLEVEGLSIRTSYIEAFEVVTEEGLNPEYSKLYNQFKKDQTSN